MVAGLLIAASLFGQGPEMRLPPITREPQITYVDRGGLVLGVRGGRFAPPIDVARLPAYVPAAFVAIEDRRFFDHGAVDPMGIARAIVSDISKGRAAQGASTITQQLARNLFLSSDKTMERKAQEAVYAMELERVYSKNQILGLYLSRVYFGSGAYGIEAAAGRYFNKPAAALTVREAAMLAAIVKAPTLYNPADNPAKSAERTRLVLDAMVQTRAIDAAERTRALAQHPKVPPEATANSGQYFVDWLDLQIHKIIGDPRQDLVVETTLDLPAERAAAEVAQATLARYKTRLITQAAVITLDGQGAVRAMVGGVDYGASPFDRVVDAHRQAGSSWKPFVYLTAMEQGRTPETIAVDEPITIAGWSPRNFEDGYAGPVALQTAFAQSLNTVAARLADEVGRPQVAATARRLGIVSPINTDPAMALGTTLVAPIEMAQAYDAFANGGDRVTAYGIERIRTTAGAVVWRRKPPAPAPVIGNPALGEMDQMMRGVIATGTGTRAALPGYDLAGKTGTTSDYKDAWFCGFTGGLTTVVWMGRDDAKPMRRITGGIAPAELWHDYMRIALKRLPHEAIPAGPAATAAPALVQTSAPATAEPAPTSSAPGLFDDIAALLGARRKPAAPPPAETPAP